MTILKDYRRRAPDKGRGCRRALILAVLLCAVVYAIVELERRAGEPDADRRPASARYDPHGNLPAPADDAADWQPLDAEQERELLSLIQDQAPLGVLEHRKAYYYLLGKVHHMQDDELAGLVDPEVTYTTIADSPQDARGRVVELEGRLLRLARTDLDPAVAPLSAVWEGQIMDSLNRIWSFVLTEPPGAPFVPGQVSAREGFSVRLQGVFMQVVVYRTRAGPPERIATPWLIGRRLVHLESPGLSTQMTPSWPLAIALAVAALCVAFLIIATLQRRVAHPAVPEDIESALDSVRQDDLSPGR